MLGMLVVQRLAGILFEMEPLDADLTLPSAIAIETTPSPTIGCLYWVSGNPAANRDKNSSCDRTPIVNLIALSPSPVRTACDAEFVDYRQHSGHRSVNERDMVVGSAPELGRGAGEQLRLGKDLGMDLHADHDLPVAGAAGNELR